ncbi:plasmid mobilization protein MobA [Azohydromonas australica]|uniref:plasmid mobilization protein MobA n=1 Tax=Azohydromonas australica TaxID=364039 RepID=UPI001EE44E7C|nr:plasmid mobilization protein MobA [Azohydromonas australica]
MSEKRKRTAMLPRVRCHEHERQTVREKAADCGMSVGQFMLAAALGRKTKTRVDEHILNELRLLGGQQKALFREGGGALQREYAALLAEITRAITRLGS